jgi:hypothetical protein
MNINKTCFFIFLIAGVLRGAGSITGVVVDPSGAVIPRCSITLRANGIEKLAQSGVEGQFAFDRLEAGSYSVEIVHAGFRNTTKTPIQVLDGAVDLGHITLTIGAVMTSCPDAAPITPTIVWLDGSPGIDGIVSIPNGASPSEIKVRIRGASATPDGTGRFSFPGLALGTYSLTVHLDGYADFVIDILEVKEDRRAQIVNALPLFPCPKGITCAPTKKIAVATLCL